VSVAADDNDGTDTDKGRKDQRVTRSTKFSCL